MDPNILDYPDQTKAPEPKLFSSLLMTGIFMVIVAASLRNFDLYKMSELIFFLAWLVLFLHFVLKVRANAKHYKKLCVRDLGRLGVMTAIMFKLLHFPFAFPIMIASGVIFAIGYFSQWFD